MVNWRAISSYMIALPAVAAVLFLAGCAVLRHVDHAMPGIRFDRANNRPLPDEENPGVVKALAAWESAPLSQRTRFPTMYHRYVDTPAPGTFEEEHIVGIAFSGGGTRGILFQAACVKELKALGAIIVETPCGRRRIDILEEVDYVAGISTGAVPAALYVLDRGGRCPERFRPQYWPECLNINSHGYALKRLVLRPDWLVRDFLVDMNTRPLYTAALASLYFEGNAFRPASGLTFGDLPRTPVLLIGATIINHPGTAFIHTRLPYRYAVDETPPLPWGVGVQSFESFHSDPMIYPLGEACYNSLSYPGTTRAGLMTVREDRTWVMDGLSCEKAERMARARNQVGYAGTYYLKDGGMVDNRGEHVIGRLCERLCDEGATEVMPLLISLDAGYPEIRAPQKGGGLLKQGWFKELAASSRTVWQTGQDAYQRLVETQADSGAYRVIRCRYSAWTRFMVPDASPSRETRYLIALCSKEPLIGTPDRLLEVARSIGTTLTRLDETKAAAVLIAARFAVWLSRDELLGWASDTCGGEAFFERAVSE